MWIEASTASTIGDATAFRNQMRLLPLARQALT